MRSFLVATLVWMLTFAPTAYADEEGSRWFRARRITVDLLLERPLGLLEVAVGAAVFVVAYPVGLVAGESEDVLDACIIDPVKHTFLRPLGKP